MAVTVQFIDTGNTAIGPTYEVGKANYLRIELKVVTTGSDVNKAITGNIFKNDQPLGNFSRTTTGILTQNWYGGLKQPIFIENGDVISAVTATPSVQTFSFIANRFGEEILGELSLARASDKALSLASGSDIKPNEVLYSAMATLQNYTDTTFSHRNPINIRNIERYVRLEVDLPDVTTNAFSDPIKLQNALDTLKPVTQKEIFDTWPRFRSTTNLANHQYWENPKTATGEAVSWTYNASLQAAVMPINSADWTGFLSQKKYDRYDHECTVISTNTGDDDFNGVVIAHKWEDGRNKTLFVQVSTNNGGPSTGNYAYSTMIIVGTDYVGGFSPESNNVKTIPNTADPKPGGNWNGRFKRIGVIRRGDAITVKVSDWGSTVYNPAKEMNFNLNDTPDLVVFKGPQSYGYNNFSQPASSFRDIYFDGGERMDAIVDIANNRIFTYSPSTGWVPAPNITPHDIYGAPRTLVDSSTGTRYVLNVDGTVTII